MAQHERNIRGPSLVDWQLELSRFPTRLLAMLASQFRDPQDPYAQAKKLKLPTPAYLFFASVGEFLDQAVVSLEQLRRQGIEQLYVGLRPESGLPKYRELGLHPEDVVPYVRQRIPLELYDSYKVMLAEYAVADYSFIMIVNPDGTLAIEIVKGEMALLATGLISPEFRAHSDPFTGRIEYEFEDVDLRRLIDRALRTIPKDDAWLEAGSSFRGVYPAGYYECSIIFRRGLPRPVFFDYRPIRPGSPFAFPSSGSRRPQVPPWPWGRRHFAFYGRGVLAGAA